MPDMIPYLSVTSTTYVLFAMSIDLMLIHWHTKFETDHVMLGPGADSLGLANLFCKNY